MPEPKPPRTAVRPMSAFVTSEAFGGLLLMFAALAAMAFANSSLATPYHDVFGEPLPWTPIPKLVTLHLWINDALMAVFFFVVGLEVKREIVAGSLSDAERLRLPVMAAVAGMAVPAAIYAAIIGDDPILDRGWAIPAATDIAFAMGVIGLLGRRIPPQLRLFLLTVAIVDDIGAVLIIAFFYSADIALGWLFASVIAAGVMVLMNWMRVDRIGAYAVVAIVLWFCVLHTGVHATIAGVIAALTIPMTRRDGRELLARVEHALAGWSTLLVVPLFGFANAGVDLRGIGPERLLSPLPLAIAAGLVAGKQIGILGAVLLAGGLGVAKRPAGTSWPQMWGASVLCGIGFTMSLFIGTMGFEAYPGLYEQAKIGILAGSLFSLVLGFAILRSAGGSPKG